MDNILAQGTWASKNIVFGPVFSRTCIGPNIMALSKEWIDWSSVLGLVAVSGVGVLYAFSRRLSPGGPSSGESTPTPQSLADNGGIDPAQDTKTKVWLYVIF